MYYFLRSYGMTDSTGPFCSRWPWLLLQSSGLTWAWKSKKARSQYWNWIGPKLHSGFPPILRKSLKKLFGKSNTLGVDLELSSGAPQTSFMWCLHMAWSLIVAGFQKVASGSCQGSSGWGWEVPEQRLGCFLLLSSSPDLIWGQRNSTSCEKQLAHTGRRRTLRVIHLQGVATSDTKWSLSSFKNFPDILQK